MATNLRKYFPIIRAREEVLAEIENTKELLAYWNNWNTEQREAFLAFCTGAKGVKVLYDAFFKEVLNPETTPERLEELLSIILKRKVKILMVLPNDSTRIADESSLLIMDIVVELEDGSIANVEVQRMGYAFPGARSACYSADLLLRQYKRVKGDKGKNFNYKNLKKVYTIIFFEKSPKEFQSFPDHYLHHFQQQSDTGIKIDLLQEFVFISLDNFKNPQHNNSINTKLDAWLTFLSADEPDKIAELITAYPEFKKLYNTIYELCLNMERVMGMFSKELREMDKNTVQYMIDEMQDEYDALKNDFETTKSNLETAKTNLETTKTDLETAKCALAAKDALIAELQKQLVDHQ